MAQGAFRACALAACAAGALAALIGPAEAQAQRTVNQVERDRRAETARAERLRGQAQAARAEVTALNARLVESGRRRSEAEAAATAAEERLTALRQQMTMDAAARQNARQALESALITAAFAERRNDLSGMRAGVFARAAAPAFNTAQRQRGQALATGRQLETAILEEQSIIADAQAAIDVERAELVSLTQRRRMAEATLSRDAAAAERRARTLAQEARNLRELTQRAAASSTRRPAASGGASSVPTAWTAPAEGRVIRAFGARESGAQATQGATVRTRSGAQVVSPAAGEVAYAGLFRSYGQVLILNMDGGYAVVLTGLADVGVRVGDTVRAGQPVGEMPDSDMTAPDLYVEVRREGRPIDPGRWLSARGVVAGGGVRAG
jgi:septal ring factor EnvC (AmiA/AmiB activator)